MKSKSIIRLSFIAFACAGSAHAVDIAFSSSTPLTFTDTQSYDNGTVDRIGGGTGTLVIFDSGANYTFSGNLTLTGAWNRVTLNTGASLTLNGTLSADVSGVSLNGGTLTAGALRLGDNPNYAGTLADGKQTLEWGDSVINGSTIIASQSNDNFISLNNDSGYASNWLWLNGDGATIDSGIHVIGNTMNTYGNGGLTKQGSGTLKLTASNNFTGNTTISNGILEVTTTGKLYGGGYTTSPTITVASTGTLRLNGWSWDAAGSIANLDYGRDRLVVNGGTIEYTGSSNPGGDDGTSSRNLTIGTGGATLKASSTAGQTWSISSANGNLINNESLTLDGAGAGVLYKVIEGSGTVTKTGAGTWTLSGTNTYSGDTTVSGGTLSLTSPSLDNDSSVIIGSGATLNLGFSGNDIIGGLEINGSGPLPAGAYNSSHGTYGSYFTGSGTLLVVTGASGTWTSLVDGDWEEPTNWASNMIASGFNQTATFNQATGVTVTLSGNQTIGNLAFDNSDYVVAGAGAITLDSAGVPAIDVGSGRTAGISAGLAGTVGMEKTGAGTLVLTGVKTYSGGTTVTAGTLELSSTTGDQAAVNGSVTVNSGATLKLSGNDYTGLGRLGSRVTALDVNGGTVDSSIESWVTGATVNLTGATMSVSGSGRYQIISSPINSLASATTSTISGNLLIRKDYGSSDLSIDVDDGAAANDLSISGSIQQVGTAGVTKLGTGKLVLSGTNTYTGNTVVYDGELEVTSTLRFRPTINGSTNAVLSATGDGSLSFTGTVDLDLSAAVAADGNAWNLFNLGSFTVAPDLSSVAAVTSTLGSFSEVSAGTWELAVNGAKWVFTEADGNLAYVNDAPPATPYQTWGSTYGLDTGSESGDLDNDGLSNFQEFAFGLIPNDGSSVNPITAQLDKTSGQFSYQRLNGSGLTYTIWTSTDLVNWTEDTTADQAVTTGSPNDSVQVTLSGAPLTASKLFVRIKAE